MQPVPKCATPALQFAPLPRAAEPGNNAPALQNSSLVRYNKWNCKRSHHAAYCWRRAAYSASSRGTSAAKPGRWSGTGRQQSRMSSASAGGVCGGMSGRRPRTITASAAWMPSRPAYGTWRAVHSHSTIAKLRARAHARRAVSRVRALAACVPQHACPRCCLVARDLQLGPDSGPQADAQHSSSTGVSGVQTVWRGSVRGRSGTSAQGRARQDVGLQRWCASTSGRSAAPRSGTMGLQKRVARQDCGQAGRF